jgi:hypothetical protein
MAELEHFRAQTERLLDLADERLDEGKRDQLRSAVEQRHGDWLPMVANTPVQGLTQRLTEFLADADRELPPEQVGELEALIRERLPKCDPQ